MAIFKRPIELWADKPFGQGDGIHSDIFITACYLLEEGQDKDVVFNFIRKGCDLVTERNIPDREIWSAISYAALKITGQAVSVRWSKPDPYLQAEIKSKFKPDLQRLKFQSSQLPQRQEEYLSLLYKPQDLICIASDAYNWQTIPREEALVIVSSYHMEFINPSPMSSTTGTTEEGKISSHCKANTGERTWLVIEFDHATLEEQHSYHQYLALTAPQKMLVYSGSKSMHGWYDFSIMTEHEAANFFDMASLLGCDPRTWSKSQFIRMPAGRNNKTTRQQKVLEFNYEH